MVLTRERPGGYLSVRDEPVNSACVELEDTGATLLKTAFDRITIDELRSEIEVIYTTNQGDDRGYNRRAKIADNFRYEMFNRSALCQKIVGHRAILDVIEPLLGEDCHIIANTCWRNPPSAGSIHGGGGWHIDGGLHIPLRNDQVWPEDIPHPVFAIGVHIFLQDCPLESGTTGVIRGNHKSGKPPPDQRMDPDLTFNGVGSEALVADSGDVAFFVSDIWHRRLVPADVHSGRFFLQVHYARRDIAQRVKPTSERNHVDAAAMERIDSDRDRWLLGLHKQGFYDG